MINIIYDVIFIIKGSCKVSGLPCILMRDVSWKDEAQVMSAGKYKDSQIDLLIVFLCEEIPGNFQLSI